MHDAPIAQFLQPRNDMVDWGGDPDRPGAECRHQGSAARVGVATHEHDALDAAPGAVGSVGETGRASGHDRRAARTTALGRRDGDGQSAILVGPSGVAGLVLEPEFDRQVGAGV